MKNDNNKKRWFYDLTEKQVYKIVAVFEVIFFIITVSRIVTTWPNEQLLAQNGMDTATAIIFTIAMLFCAMVAIGVLIWLILWENPRKQNYLYWEKIVPNIRKKFGLSSDFKEVLSKSEKKLHCYAKETENGIFVSLRDENGEQLDSDLIENYDYFDSNYEPKV